MKQNTKNTIIVTSILIVTLLSSGLFVTVSSSGGFHAIKGALYINGYEAPAGIPITLTFPTSSYTRTTSSMSHGFNYVISFQGHDSQTGNFSVFFQDQYHIPDDNATVTIIQEVIGYYINLHIIIAGGGNIPPVAKPGGPYIGQVNKPVMFSAAQSYDLDGTIVGYRWDWNNDGVFDTDWLTTPTASHSYPTEGQYIVRLQVKDNEDAVGDATTNITVSTHPSTNQEPYTPHTPQPVNYGVDQSVFSDLSWFGGDPDTGNIVFYDLYFGTSNPPVFYTATAGFSATQSYITYNLPQLAFGTQYYWRIIAHDNHGASSTAPVWTFRTLAFGVDTEPPSQVTGLIVTNKHNGKLLLDWNPAVDNWGVHHYQILRNGVILTNTTATSYQDTGLTNGQTYTYQVSAVDSSANQGPWSEPVSGTPTQFVTGGSGDGSEAFSNNFPPFADLSAGEPYRGVVGEAIFFNGSKSYDTDGTIVTWLWSFGDGTNGTGETTTHIYTMSGTFTVKLLITDNEGLSDTDITTAVITTPNLPPTNLSFDGPPKGKIHILYTFTLMANDPEGGDLFYTVDWGDNTSTALKELPDGTTALINHTWTTAGIYKITVVVQDDQNAANSVTHDILINVEYTGETGYLIDTGNGVYDVFYSNLTDSRTIPELQSNGVYYLDVNGDGLWDHIYDPILKQLTVFPTSQVDDPQGSSALLVLYSLLSLIIVLFFLLLIMTRKKKEA